MKTDDQRKADDLAAAKAVFPSVYEDSRPATCSAVRLITDSLTEWNDELKTQNHPITLTLRMARASIKEQDGIILAVYRSMNGGSDFVQSEAKRLVEKYIEQNAQADRFEP